MGKRHQETIYKKKKKKKNILKWYLKSLKMLKFTPNERNAN